MPGPAVRIPAAVVGVLIVQDAALRGLRLDGVRPDLLLGLAVTAAALGGPERAAVVGFAAGMVADLFAPTPMGMSALVWSVLGYVVGGLQGSILPQGRLGMVATTFVASAAGEVLFALVGSVLGQPGMVTSRLVPIALIVAAFNALASPALAALARWSLSRGDDRSFVA